jgi:hypothetical protein
LVEKQNLFRVSSISSALWMAMESIAHFSVVTENVSGLGWRNKLVIAIAAWIDRRKGSQLIIVGNGPSF